VLRLGGTPAAALQAAAERSGLDELRAAAAALEAAERWGAPPAEALAARAANRSRNVYPAASLNRSSRRNCPNRLGVRLRIRVNSLSP